MTEYRESPLYQGAHHVVSTIVAAGYEAYFVGGSVRDILMGRIPHDYDIATNAKPEEVIRVLTEKGIPTTGVVGASFGVVIAKWDGFSYEVATFRSESYGDHSHRPESVTYASSFQEDVDRRDFTVNGMAMTMDGVILDLVGGQEDLAKKQMRTIGRSEERFQEDALRMFRLCRFVGQLGFSIEAATIQGVADNIYRVQGLSLERVRTELERMLLSDHPDLALDALVMTGLNKASCQRHHRGTVSQVEILPELTHLVNLPQSPEYHRYDAWHHTLAVVKATPKELILRWAALLHDVAKGLPGIRGFHNGRYTDRGHDEKGSVMTKNILARLGYGDDFVNRVVWLVNRHMKFHFFVNHPEGSLAKWIGKEGRSGLFRDTSSLVDGIEQLVALGVADVLGGGTKDPVSSKTYGHRMIETARRFPVHTKDLHYDKQLPKELGPAVKDIMQALLQRVQTGTLENETKALREAAYAMYRRWKIKKESKE